MFNTSHEPTRSYYSCSLCFWNALSLFSHKSMSRRFLYLAAQRRNYGSLSMKFRPLSTSSLKSHLSAWVLSKLVGTNYLLMQALKSSQFGMTYFLPMWTRFCLECHHSSACVINLEVHKSTIQYLLLLIMNGCNFSIFFSQAKYDIGHTLLPNWGMSCIALWCK